MKKRWKKINRGLLLGAVLLVGLVGFIVFKEVQFRQELPKIRESAEAYVQDLLALNVSLEGEELGKDLTDEQRAQKKAALDKLIADRMATGDGEEGNYYVLTASELRANYEEMLEGAPATLYRNLEFDIPENRINVTSEGSDYAYVSIYLQNISVEACGMIDQMFGGESTKYYYDTEIYDKEFAEGEEFENYIDKTWYTCTFGGNATLQMQRVDGEWKVTGVYCYTWSQSVREINEKEAVKE
ncbi:MAG: hypothetical protein IJW55_00720 [Clostridia bacterium]|nr:hypothetical protein [Clostridia bacterium]